MQDPSGLVAPQLLFKPDFSKAFEYLSSAPGLINEVKPVAWTYLAPPPPPGTILLEWMSPARLPTQYSTDGYAWLDVEQVSRMEINGYIMEIFFHLAGFSPESKTPQVVSRYRIRLLTKSNAATPVDDPDPSLWIVHYCRPDNPPPIPPSFLATRPDVVPMLQDRNAIERLGVITRKEFMFKDRNNWPTVPFPNPNIPGGQMPTGAGVQPNPMAPPPHPGVAAQYFQAAQGMPVAPHPAMAKRPPVPAPAGQPVQTTPTAAGAVPPPAAAADGTPSRPEPSANPDPSAIFIAQQVAADTLREEEENNLLGDALDHLTPRDISLMRYVRHHEWMEEILNSPFTTTNIVPVDLGLGLAGALEPLTDGLLHAPGVKTVEPVPVTRRNAPAVMVVPPMPIVRRLDKPTIDEVERRVNKFVEEGEAELVRLRDEHAKIMAEWRKDRVYARAEKRLRDIYHGDVNELKNPEIGAAIDPYDLIEETAAAVERVTKMQFIPRDRVELVNRGGLLDVIDDDQFRTTEEKTRMDAFAEDGPETGPSSASASALDLASGLDMAWSMDVDGPTVGDRSTMPTQTQSGTSISATTVSMPPSGAVSNASASVSNGSMPNSATLP